MKTIFSLFLWIPGICSQLFAQISILYPTHLEDLKNGTTYVVCQNYDSEEMAPYRQVFVENWTFSEISFISPDEAEEYYQVGNSFITLGGSVQLYIQTVEFTSINPRGGSHSSTVEGEIYHTRMELGIVPDPEKMDEANNSSTPLMVAYLELFTDFETAKDPTVLAMEDMGGGGRIRGWGPGVLKNKIQQLTAELELGRKKKLYKPTVTRQQLSQLKTSELLVPDYCLIHFAPLTGDESERISQDKLLKSYRFPVKMVTTEELNQRIMSGEELFYLHYVKIVGNKYIEVVNSVTGEIIYFEAKSLRYNIKGRDFRKLSRAIRFSR